MPEACQLCGSNEYQVVSRSDRHGKPLDTVLCMGCGIVTNDPIPSVEELEKFYRSEYREEYKGSSEPRKRQILRNFRRMENHFKRFRDLYASRRNCLDLGSGSGEFLFMANAMGIKSVGIEPHLDYSQYCRDKLGLNVRTQALEDTEFPDGEFDLIRLSHVLEHMRQPVETLKILRKWLAEDGVLYVEVPNIAADAQRKISGSLFHYGHIFNFNPFTLRLAAALAGLEELPEAKKRISGTTGVFLRKSKAPPELFSGAESNALKMKAILEAHFANVLPKPMEGTALSRFVRSLSARVGEQINSNRFRDGREIANQFARRLAKAD